MFLFSTSSPTYINLVLDFNETDILSKTKGNFSYRKHPRQVFEKLWPTKFLTILHFQTHIVALLVKCLIVVCHFRQTENLIQNQKTGSCYV